VDAERVALARQDKVEVVRRLGVRIVEICWDGQWWWPWQILDGTQSLRTGAFSFGRRPGITLNRCRTHRSIS